MIDILKKIKCSIILNKHCINPSVLSNITQDTLIKLDNTDIMGDIGRYPKIIQCAILEDEEFSRWFLELNNKDYYTIGIIENLLSNNINIDTSNQSVKKLLQLEYVRKQNMKKIFTNVDAFKFVLERVDSENIENILDYTSYVLENGDSHYFDINSSIIEFCNKVDKNILLRLMDKIHNEGTDILFRFIIEECSAEFKIQESLLEVDSLEMYNTLVRIKDVLGNENFIQYFNNVFDLSVEKHEQFLKHILLMDKTVYTEICNERFLILMIICDKSYLKFGKELMQPYYSELRNGIITYALENNCFNFIKLCKDNLSEISSINLKSLFYNKNIYSKIVDIESMTFDDVKVLITLTSDWTMFNLFTHKVSVEDLKYLYGLSKNYIILADKIMQYIPNYKEIIRNFVTFDTLIGSYTENEIENIASWLKHNEMKNLIEQCNIINEGKAYRMLVAIIAYGKDYLFKQIKDDISLLFAYNNLKELDNNSVLADLENDFMVIDENVKEIINETSLDQEFINKNYKRLKEFSFKGGCSMSVKFLRNPKLRRRQRAIFKSIVRKVIDDSYNEFNISTSVENFQISISNNFFDIMNYSVEPKNKLLSYINGVYSDALLSLFRKDHKVITVRKNNTILANGILRECKFNNKKVVILDNINFVYFNKLNFNYLLNHIIEFILNHFIKEDEEFYISNVYANYVIKNLRTNSEEITIYMNTDDYGPLFNEFNGKFDFGKNGITFTDTFIKCYK